MSGLPLDISQLDGDQQREFLEHRHTRDVLAVLKAEEESLRMARALQERGLREGRKSIEGLGAPVAEIPQTSFHYWGRRLGYQCWHDEQFVREYLRDNPQARVKAKGTKEIQVGYVGGAEGGVTQRAQSGNTESAEGKRFRKSYGAKAGEVMMRRALN